MTTFLETFLQIIAWIASKEYQRRVWIEAQGPEANDFDETCNCFFDTCEPLLQDSERLGINKKQKELVIQFRDEFQSFADENDWPAFFIDTPEWTHITEMAEEVLQAFNYPKRLK